MEKKFNYVQKMDIKYTNLELIDVPAIVKENKEK